MHLDLIGNYSGALEELTARIEVVIEPFRAAQKLIVTIPGISTAVADVIIAETGADMSRFLSAGHLASWAGTCPGSNESAGRVKSTRTRPGNPYLKGALGVAALSASRSKNTYFAAKYRRIASRRGPIKAIVALEHAMLIAVWTCSTPVRSTAIRERSSSPVSTPTEPGTARSTSFVGWVIRSPSSP